LTHYGFLSKLIFTFVGEYMEPYKKALFIFNMLFRLFWSARGIVKSLQITIK